MLLARYTNWNRHCSALWRRLRLQRVKMRNDAIDVKVNKGSLAFFAEEEVTVLVVVHEEVFGEDGRAGGVAEEVEVGFEGGGEGLGLGVATGGVGAPAAGGEPAVATAGVVAAGGEGVHDAAGKEDVLGVFQETAVGAALTRRFTAMAVVDEDFHS